MGPNGMASQMKAIKQQFLEVLFIMRTMQGIG